MNATMVASVLLEHDKKYLLVQQARSRREAGRWGPPGGKPEHDLAETLFEAARRETLEETGLDIELTGLVGLIRSGHHREPNLMVCFAGRLTDPAQADRLNLKAGEISNGRWLSIAEIEGQVVPLRASPLVTLYRRLADGLVYPLELMLHEPVDPE